MRLLLPLTLLFLLPAADAQVALHDVGGDLSASDAASPSSSRAALFDVRAEGTFDDEVALSWSHKSAGEAGFRILRSAGDASLSEIATIPIAERSYTDAPPDPFAIYAYRVEVVDADGNAMERSEEIRVRPVRARNARLVGAWDGRDAYADVWGYVAPDGREYALVALRTMGLSIVDVTDEVPVEVGFVPTEEGAVDSKDVKVRGEYAYLVNELGPVQIVSLADPTAPVQVGAFDVQPGMERSGAHNATVDGDHLYVTGGRSGANGVLIYDLAADPENPPLVGSYHPYYYHDFYVDGDRGYGAAIGGQGVDILDLSDRTDPRLLGTFNYPGSGAHNVCGAPGSDYVFVGDEVGSGTWTRVFDVADPLDVEYVRDIIVDPQAVAHNCYVAGDLLYIGHYTEGLQVFDVSDPLSPERVAFYDTYAPAGYGFRGAWSVYPYLPSGKILVSDRSTGLHVIRIGSATVASEPEPAELAALVVAPNPSRGDARVEFSLDSPSEVRLRLFDVLGREVRTLVDGPLGAGPHEVAVPRNGLAPGSYVLRLVTDGAPRTARLTLLR